MGWEGIKAGEGVSLKGGVERGRMKAGIGKGLGPLRGS